MKNEKIKQYLDLFAQVLVAKKINLKKKISYCRNEEKSLLAREYDSLYDLYLSCSAEVFEKMTAEQLIAAITDCTNFWAEKKYEKFGLPCLEEFFSSF